VPFVTLPPPPADRPRHRSLTPGAAGSEQRAASAPLWRETVRRGEGNQDEGDWIEEAAAETSTLYCCGRTEDWGKWRKTGDGGRRENCGVVDFWILGGEWPD